MTFMKWSVTLAHMLLGPHLPEMTNMTHSASPQNAYAYHVSENTTRRLYESMSQSHFASANDRSTINVLTPEYTSAM
jgi:hypothetical protein